MVDNGDNVFLRVEGLGEGEEFFPEFSTTALLKGFVHLQPEYKNIFFIYARMQDVHCLSNLLPSNDCKRNSWRELVSANCAAIIVDVKPVDTALPTLTPALPICSS